MTEEEMRETQAPTPKTSEELQAYIDSLVTQDHDYGTCVYAMSMAATATFNYVAKELGVTSFQAGCADLDVIRRIRRIKGPFAIIDADNMVYPQYDILGKVHEYLKKWKPWAAKEAKKKLSAAGEHVAPAVVAHWKHLAASAEKD